MTTLVVRSSLWLLVIAWGTIGLLAVALHFLIVPRIGELRPWLEQQASRELGVSVRIGAIEARSNGLIPSFEIRDVVLLDAQGREALKVPSVLAALSARSLLSLGFEQLHVEGLVLEVRRALDGQIWVAGLALPQQQTSDSARADWLFEQTELAIRHGTLHWTDESRAEPTLTLTDVDLVLRNSRRRHDMRLDATPPAAWGERFTVRG
ncbi:MAG: TIGR02099 family protein, partial [Rhodoferax sp.]|nr:TIGR02099 family protein [Rhodoferax sp.]